MSEEEKCLDKEKGKDCLICNKINRKEENKLNINAVEYMPRKKMRKK